MNAGAYAQLAITPLILPLPPTVVWEDARQDPSSSDFERRIAARRCSDRRTRE